MQSVRELIEDATKTAGYAEAALARLSGLYERKAAAHVRYADAKIMIKSLESEIGANAGWGEYTIDGPNAAVRDAQLVNAIHKHPDWQEANKDLREAERERIVTDGEIDSISNTLSITRSKIDICVALIRRQTVLDTPITTLRGGATNA